MRYHVAFFGDAPGFCLDPECSATTPTLAAQKSLDKRMPRRATVTATASASVNGVHYFATTPDAHGEQFIVTVRELHHGAN